MNTAYHDYLTAMLADYPADTDHKQAVASFFEWVDVHERTGQDRDGEPDVYHYGDAAGTHPVGYLDMETLRERGIDPATIPDPSQLLCKWAERLHDALCEDEWDGLYSDTLAEAYRDCGLDPDEHQWANEWAALIEVTGMPGWTKKGPRLTKTGPQERTLAVEPAWQGRHPSAIGTVEDHRHNGTRPWFTLTFNEHSPKEMARLAATLLQSLAGNGAQGFAEAFNATPYIHSHALLDIELHADSELLTYYDRPDGTWKLTTRPELALSDEPWFGDTCRRPGCKAAPMQARCVNQCASCGRRMCEDCTSRCVECGQTICDDCAATVNQHGERRCVECAEPANRGPAAR